MHTIKLKSLSLENFKGVRELTVNFPSQVTVISGENGTGKTTIFDAFCWLLFGKDSKGRSDSNFAIKTIDPETKKPILRLSHSVTGVLEVDGTQVKLQRCYCERWLRANKNTEERLAKHETEFYINDVKLGTKKEYDAEINEILPEDVFKMITNPYCFTSLRPEEQKAILLEMVGTVNDADVAQLNEDFVALLGELNGRPLVKFLKELVAQKKACQDVLAVIPSQIDTANRLRPEEENWAGLQAELDQKKKRLEAIDAQISDKSKANEQEYQRRSQIQREIGKARLELAQIENQIDADANAVVNQAKGELQKLEFNLSHLRQEQENCDAEIKRFQEEIARVKSRLDDLRAQWRAINAEQISYPDGAFVCPTCKRPLEADDMAAKQAELQANFNQDKSARLRLNTEQGKNVAAKLKELEAGLADAQRRKDGRTPRIADLESKIQEKRASIPATPDTTQAKATDPRCVALRNQIADLENQLTVEAPTIDTSKLLEEKRIFQDNIQELVTLLAKRDQIARADKEIKELEEKRVANNQMLADLEKWEYIATEFQKAKDNVLQERINGLFQVVSFTFIAERLNGAEKVTCSCNVNGTPYADVNKAGKLNAGLDIINAICTSKGISAPIFIDNRESVNEIIPTVSQVINLRASLDPQITVQ